MTKRLLLLVLIAVTSVAAQAQKFAVVDMQYILKNIPAYERANEQLNQVSKKWEAEVAAVQKEAQTLYRNYQNESVFLSEEQKKKREEAILAKEKEASELQKSYFGTTGELFKKRQALIAPIQDEIYQAVKELSDAKGYSLVIDRSADNGIIFSSPKVDISNDVLAKLGISN